jgi:RNA polymerase sigma-70 factor (ECF subfamily)
MSQQERNPGESDLVNRIIRGDCEALAELFSLHRDRLWGIVNFRLDRRLAGRIDADDVLQEAYLRASERMERFLHDASQSCFVWLRLIVTQTMIDIHRRHLGSQSRDARRETSIDVRWDSASTSASLSFSLAGRLTSPSNAAMRAELVQQLDAALAAMSDLDREVLALRHHEQLTNRETALVLDMTEQAASLRYIRALERLKKLLPDAFVEHRNEASRNGRAAPAAVHRKSRVEPEGGDAGQ